MGVDDSKRFYWLKLRKDFFQQHQIKVLKSQPNGRLYALIYLELMAESTSHNGELRYSELLPYDSVTLAAVIDEDKDNLEKAIEVLCNLGLVEILEDRTIYLTELHKLLGSETGQTIRKNLSKLQGGKSEVKITKEYRVKSIENRDKNIYNTKFSKPTIEELNQYCKEKGYSIDTERFFNYYESKGWLVGKAPMKSWKAALTNWSKNDFNNKPTKKQPRMEEIDF